MQIQAIRNDNISFGHKLPNKRTYRAMQAYYELLNDKGSAVEFRMLDHEARARLHYMNFKKAESKILDLPVINP